MPRFADIELEALIGRGGMAEVYRGRFVGGPRAGWPVAIKRLNAQRSAEPLAVELFLSEGELSKQLKHPNIVEVYDSGVLGGIPFITMELVEGSDLALIIRRGNDLGIDLPVDFGCFLAASSAEGLHYAHQAKSASGRPLGIVHCDVSPSNVFVSRTGEIKLGDFGVARAAGGPKVEGGAFGKLGYISPEQLRGDPVSPSSDIYALGLLTYELLTGERAYPTDDPKEMLKLMRKPPTAPSAVRDDLPKSIDAAVLATLDPKPERRTPTALAFADHLRQSFDDRVGTPLAIAALVRGLFEPTAAPEAARSRPKTVKGVQLVRPSSPAPSTRPRSTALKAAVRPPPVAGEARPSSRGVARPVAMAKTGPIPLPGQVAARPPSRKAAAVAPPPPASHARPSTSFFLQSPAHYEAFLPLLGALHRKRGNGWVVAEGGGHTRHLLIGQGRLVEAQSTAPEEQLAGLLLSGRLMRLAEVARLNDLARGRGISLERVLREDRVLDEKLLVSLCERQALAIFQESVKHGKEGAIRPSPTAVPRGQRWVGALVVDAWRRGLLRTTGTTQRLTLLPEAGRWAPELELTPSELKVLQHLAAGEPALPADANSMTWLRAALMGLGFASPDHR